MPRFASGTIVAVIFLHFNFGIIIFKFGLSEPSPHYIVVNDSLTLDKLMRLGSDGKTGGHRKSKQIQQALYKRFVLDLDPSEFSGFMVTLRNLMDEVDDEHSCTLLNSAISLKKLLHFPRSSKVWWQLLLPSSAKDEAVRHRKKKQQEVNLGCSQYSVHFIEAPLMVTTMPAILTDLVEKGIIKLVFTGARIGCGVHRKFRQCPNHPAVCIQRHLFCDSVDNCGLDLDEKDCFPRLRHIAVELIDGRSISLERLRQVGLFVLGAAVLIVFIVLPGWLFGTRGGQNFRLAFFRRFYAERRRRKSRQQSLAAVSTTANPSAKGKSKIGACFGGLSSVPLLSRLRGQRNRRLRRGTEAGDETVALLTLSLRHAFMAAGHQLPAGSDTLKTTVTPKPSTLSFRKRNCGTRRAISSVAAPFASTLTPALAEEKSSNREIPSIAFTRAMPLGDDDQRQNSVESDSQQQKAVHFQAGLQQPNGP